MRARVRPRHRLGLVVEQLDPRRRALDPLLVGARDEDAGVERVGELDVGAVEVRMRHADRVDAAERRAIRCPARLVQQGDAVPQHVAVRGAHQQRPLADRERRLDADADQVGLLLAEHDRVVAAPARPWSSTAGRPSRRTGARPRRWGSAAGGCSVSGYCTPQVAQIHAGIGVSSRPGERRGCGAPLIMPGAGGLSREGYETMAHLADALDPGDELVAGREPALRAAAHARRPAGVPVKITSPGSSGSTADSFSMSCGHRDEQQAGPGLLHLLAVDRAAQLQVVRVVELVDGDQPRARSARSAGTTCRG